MAPDCTGGFAFEEFIAVLALTAKSEILLLRLRGDVNGTAPVVVLESNVPVVVDGALPAVGLPV